MIINFKDKQLVIICTTIVLFVALTTFTLINRQEGIIEEQQNQTNETNTTEIVK